MAPLAGLDGFNLYYQDPDTSSLTHFLQAYYELHQADYNYNGGEPCRQVLADNARHYRRRDTILIGALRYCFNYIDSNAVRNIYSLNNHSYAAANSRRQNHSACWPSGRAW